VLQWVREHGCPWNKNVRLWDDGDI
jgi:hypothetical protein